MKRMIQVFLAFSVASMFLVSPVMAATSQGLTWGVAVNDEFTYRFKMIDEGEVTLDEGINVTITSRPSIPDPVSYWSDLPLVGVDIVFTNGTTFGLYIFALFGLLFLGGSFAVPIGNYTLLAALAQDSIWWTENHTMVNDGSYFGSRMSGTSEDIRSVAYAHYLKSDGFLSHYVVEATNTTSQVKSSVSLIRDGLGLDIIGWIQDNLLLVGIGVGIVVIAGVVICAKRK